MSSSAPGYDPQLERMLRAASASPSPSPVGAVMKVQVPLWQPVSRCPHCGSPIWIKSSEMAEEKPPMAYLTCACSEMARLDGEHRRAQLQAQLKTMREQAIAAGSIPSNPDADPNS